MKIALQNKMNVNQFEWGMEKKKKKKKNYIYLFY